MKMVNLTFSGYYLDHRSDSFLSPNYLSLPLPLTLQPQMGYGFFNYSTLFTSIFRTFAPIFNFHRL